MRNTPLLYRMLCVLVVTGSPASFGAAVNPIVFENADFRYVIGTKGRKAAFVDRATGRDYLRTNEPSPCALAWAQGKPHSATAATLADGRLTLRFGESGLTAVLKTEIRPSCVLLSVESVRGGE